MVKRWWWVVVAAVILVAFGAWILMSRGAANAPGKGAVATSTVGPYGNAPQITSPAPPPKLAAAGAKLTPFNAPPENMVSQFGYNKDSDGLTLGVTFRIYGLGPVRDGRKTAAVEFSNVVAPKNTTDQLLLQGKNALVQLGPGVTLPTGGTYTGVVTFTKQGDALLLVLTSAKLK
jgi:hypothetical protein